MKKKRHASKTDVMEVPPQKGTKEVTLVSVLIDDSSSIAVAGNVNAIIRGYRAFLAETRKSEGDVWLRFSFFHNRREGKGFVPIVKARGFTERTYLLKKGTPLYISVFEELRVFQDEVDRLTALGYDVRTIFVLFADGQDNRSGCFTSVDVERRVKPMKATGKSVFAARGVNYGGIDFWPVFQSMSFDRHQIEILKGGHELVASMASTGGGVAAASTNEASFHRTMTGGLGRKTDAAPA